MSRGSGVRCLDRLAVYGGGVRERRESRTRARRSATFRAIAEAAQDERRALTGAPTNARLDPAAVRHVAALDEAGRRLLRSAVERLRLSGRSYDRLLRVARTLADLDASDATEARHVAEALQFRSMPAAE